MRSPAHYDAGMPLIRQAQFSGDMDDTDLCRTLMREYAAHLNASVGDEHICVESLEQELAALPGPYAPPAGAVLLALHQDEPAGCVALKPIMSVQPASTTKRACEMKRLWVRPGQQGTGLGRRLAEDVIQLARERGYTAMYLDTMPATMQAAHHLYVALGFQPVDRYNHNPVLRQSESLEIAFLRKDL